MQMLSEFQVLGEELGREIIMIQQSLTLKTLQLEETRKKLHQEIIEHQMIKNCLDKSISDMDDLKMELELNVKANAKLEEENAKQREIIAKLQTQCDSYMNERQILMDRCHNADVENCTLRNKVGDLQDKLEESVVYNKRFEQYQHDIKILIDQILSKQEILNKDHSRLEKALKEGLAFATKLSEELNIKDLFLKEANMTRIKLEEALLKLAAALEAEKIEKRKLLESSSSEIPKSNYLADWKLSQEQAEERLRNLLNENLRLLNEIEGLQMQLDMQKEKEMKIDF